MLAWVVTMADGGEELLAGTILGQLSQLTGPPLPPLGVAYPIKIYNVEPMMEANDYRTTIKVEMASGTYYVSITDFDPSLPKHRITEEP